VFIVGVQFASIDAADLQNLSARFFKIRPEKHYRWFEEWLKRIPGRHKKSPALLQVTGPVYKKSPVPKRFLGSVESGNR